jgi:hypothetical protein
MCSGRVGSSCSTNDNRGITFVTNVVKLLDYSTRGSTVKLFFYNIDIEMILTNTKLMMKKTLPVKHSIVYSPLCEIGPTTSLIPPLYIKVFVPSQDSDTCIRGIYFVSVSTISVFDFVRD